MMISADVLRTWAVTESITIAAGAELGAFGFDSGGRWTAILGGPTVLARATLLHGSSLGSFGLALGLHLDAGRLPTCSKAGICLLYSGFFPAASLRASYSPSERVTFDIGGAARVVNTLAWVGLGGEALFAGVLRF